MTTFDTPPAGPATPAERTSGFHPAHVGHLVMGLAFLGLTSIWAVVQAGLVSTSDLRWLLPLPWVFAGIAGLLAVTLSGRGRRSVTPAATAAAESTPDLFDSPTDLLEDTDE